VPALLAGSEGGAQARSAALRNVTVAAAARAAAARPRPPVRPRPRAECRACAVAGVDAPAIPEVRKGLPRTPTYPPIGERGRCRPRTPATRGPSSSAASNSGRERWRSWSSIRSTTRRPVARARPHTYSAFATWPRWR
jgi:hypothetical protein